MRTHQGATFYNMESPPPNLPYSKTDYELVRDKNMAEVAEALELVMRMKMEM